MHGRFALLGISIALAAAPAQGQTSAASMSGGQPATSQSSTQNPDEQMLAFREAAQGRMTVPVTIAQSGPFDFIVDTGAERSIVSNELARALSLAGGPRVTLFDFTGPSVVNTVTVPALSVSRLGATAMEAPALAMQDIGASGMLGVDMLRGQKVAIDFPRNRMTLTPAKRHASGEYVVRAKAGDGQLIVTDARFYGKPIAVVIDTGSWVSVGNRAMLALSPHSPRRFGPIQVTSVTGRTFDAELVAVDQLSIGGVQFGNFGLTFADVPPFERLGLRDTPALILGMSSLKLFRHVELDFANREVAFTLPVPPIDFSSLCHNVTSPCHTY